MNLSRLASTNEELISLTTKLSKDQKASDFIEEHRKNALENIPQSLLEGLFLPHTFHTSNFIQQAVQVQITLVV